MINVIDTFSKFAWALPIKNKDGTTVSKAFEKIIKTANSQNHTPPSLLHMDKGLEFENKHFKTLLNNYGIHMYHTQNLEKCAIVGRFNRTIKNKMRILFEVRNNKKCFDILQNLLDEYNFKDKHRCIGMIPVEVNKSNENLVLRAVFKQLKKKNTVKFQVGYRVKITKFKNPFGNKYDSNWTREIFVITEILNTEPINYKIKDLDNEEIVGIFYNEELQKTIF